MQSKRASRLPLALSFVALGLLVLLWWAIHSWYREKLLAEQRAHVATELAPYENALSGAINRRLGLLRALKAFVETHISVPPFETEFHSFATGLYRGTTGIRVLTVAPRGVQRYVHPLDTNENVPGHDLMRDPRPEVRADVERAIQSRQITLSGPYELRQGRLGVVGRLAVYQKDTFWGLVTVALDLQPILELAGLNPAPAGLKLALRSRAGQTFFGDSNVFEHEPVIYRIELPEGYWELAAVPRDGWNASIHEPLAILNGAALIIVLSLTMLVYLGVNREARLTLEVKERTEEIHQAKEELERDIAERQRLQEQLIENGRLAAIGATAAKVAHEIGNPLNGMFLTAQRLERHLAGQPCYSDQAVQSTLRRLRDEIRRLNQLLNDFRSLSRREQYNFQPTSLAMIAGEIFATEAESYTAKGIRVEQLFPRDLPLVHVDRDKLKQALWNLCKNAVEAMPQGGTLTLNAYSSGADVVLEIGDTGVGIPPGIDIFEPFTTTKSSGSGLGLMVVRQVVAAHGGSVTYAGEPGKGTMFRLTLPQAALQYAAV